MRLFGCAAALVGLCLAGASAAQCRLEYQQRLNECTEGRDAYRGGRQLGNADFSYIDECRRKIRPQFEACLSGETLEPGPCDWQEAKTNIDWVMAVDPPALRTFTAYRDRGYSAIDAVVEAQGHNRNAQKSIRRCVALAIPYLEEKYPEKIGGRRGCKLADAKANIDWVMAADEPAYRTYLAYRDRGNSPLDSVIGAQSHNPNAQESIRRCGQAAANYLAGRYGDKLGARPGTAAARPDVDLNCLDIVDRAPAYLDDAMLQGVRLRVRSRCAVRVRATFCVAFGKSAVFSSNATVDPGATRLVTVSDRRLRDERLRDPSWHYVSHQACYRGKCAGSCDQ